MTSIWTPRGSHAGNRWWVAYNTNQGPLGHSDNTFSGFQPSGYEAIGSGNATDDAIFAHAKHDGKTTVSVQHENWLIMSGPYPSYTAAQAGVVALQKTKPAPGAVQQTTGVSPSAFTDVGHALSAFFGALTNWRMWASLGWVLLGLGLFLAGSVLLVKGEITRSVIPGVK
jgi:hypothetical protein